MAEDRHLEKRYRHKKMSSDFDEIVYVEVD